MQTPENLLGKDSLQPYVLTSPPDILDILQTLQNRNTVLRTHLQPVARTTITSLLDINASEGFLALSMSRWEAEMDPADFLAAEDILTETSLDASHIQFAGQDVIPHEGARRPALRVPIPTRLLHIQRRDDYRLLTSTINPVYCTITPGVGTKPAILPVEDISCGGVCLIDEQAELEHLVGKIYPNCSIELPGIGVVTVALQLAHVTPQAGTGKTRYRVGCAFLRPTNAMALLVRRYITHLEREEIARKRGFI